MDAESQEWIGAKPTRLQMSAFLLVAVVALIFAGVQPVLFGALIAEGRLTASGLGWATTAEFLCVGAGVGLAGAFLPPRRLRFVGSLACAVFLIANLVILRQSGVGIVVNRSVAGLAEGIMAWLPALIITRSATPARWSGIFLGLQAVAQLLFAAALPVTLMRSNGANGGYIALAACAGLAALAVLILPKQLAALPKGEKEDASPALTSASWSSLAAVFLLYAFFIGFFAYLAQLGAQAGLTPTQSGFAVSTALGVSIFGSGLAAVLPRRLSYYSVFVACMPLSIGVLVVLNSLPSVQVFTAAAAVFGFCWGILMPYQAPFVISIDPTRRAALLAPGIQGLGCSAGPFLCAFVVTPVETRGVLWVSGACLGLFFLLASVLQLSRRGGIPGPVEAPTSPLGGT